MSQTVTQDEFISLVHHLSGMPREAAVQTLERWLGSGRVKQNRDGTIDRRYVESEWARDPEHAPKTPEAEAERLGARLAAIEAEMETLGGKVAALAAEQLALRERRAALLPPEPEAETSTPKKKRS